MDQTRSARTERRSDDVAALLARAQSGDPRDPALVAALDAALEPPASQMDPVQRVNLWAQRCWAHHVAGARDVALRCAQQCHDEVRGRSPLAEGMACATSARPSRTRDARWSRCSRRTAPCASSSASPAPTSRARS